MAEQGVERAIKLEEEGVDREWAFRLSWLTRDKVAGPVGKGEVLDGPCRLCRAASA